MASNQSNFPECPHHCGEKPSLPKSKCPWCGFKIPCRGCAKDIKFCPSCFADRSYTRTTQERNMLPEFEFPSLCQHQWTGFYETPRKVIECPMKRPRACRWTGLTRNGLRRHIWRMHPSQIVPTHVKSFTFHRFRARLDVKTRQYDVTFFNAYAEFFHLSQNFDFVRGVVEWGMFLHGEIYKRRMFRFEVIIKDFTGCFTDWHLHAPCNVFLDEDVLEINYLCVNVYHFARYCFQDILTYLIQIHRV